MTELITMVQVELSRAKANGHLELPGIWAAACRKTQQDLPWRRRLT
jgi:hypothetical protein